MSGEAQVGESGKGSSQKKKCPGSQEMGTSARLPELQQRSDTAPGHRVGMSGCVCRAGTLTGRSVRRYIRVSSHNSGGRAERSGGGAGAGRARGWRRFLPGPAQPGASRGPPAPTAAEGGGGGREPSRAPCRAAQPAQVTAEPSPAQPGRDAAGRPSLPRPRALPLPLPLPRAALPLSR